MRAARYNVGVGCSALRPDGPVEVSIAQGSQPARAWLATFGCVHPVPFCCCGFLSCLSRFLCGRADMRMWKLAPVPPVHGSWLTHHQSICLLCVLSRLVSRPSSRLDNTEDVGSGQSKVHLHLHLTPARPPNRLRSTSTDPLRFLQYRSVKEMALRRPQVQVGLRHQQGDICLIA